MDLDRLCSISARADSDRHGPGSTGVDLAWYRPSPFGIGIVLGQLGSTSARGDTSWHLVRLIQLDIGSGWRDSTSSLVNSARYGLGLTRLDSSPLLIRLNIGPGRFALTWIRSTRVDSARYRPWPTRLDIVSGRFGSKSVWVDSAQPDLTSVWVDSARNRPGLILGGFDSTWAWTDSAGHRLRPIRLDICSSRHRLRLTLLGIILYRVGLGTTRFDMVRADLTQHEPGLTWFDVGLDLDKIQPKIQFESFKNIFNLYQIHPIKSLRLKIKIIDLN